MKVTVPEVLGEPSPIKTIHYSIGGKEKAGALHLYYYNNNHKSSDVVVENIVLCCAGFADDHQAFMPYASELAKHTEHCLVGVTCIPGYDHRDEFPYTSHKRDGYTFDEWSMAMKDAVKVLRNEEKEMNTTTTTEKKAKFTAIFHDWGVLNGLKFVNRVLEEESTELIPDRIALFDVLSPAHPQCKTVPANVPKQSWYEYIIERLYRIILAKTFVLGRYVSSTIAAVYMLSSLMILGVLRLGPLYDHVDGKIFQMKKVIPMNDMKRIVYMTYPYSYMVHTWFSPSKAQEFIEGLSLPLDLERTPILYLYGTEKRCQFHDLEALQLLKNTKTCKVIAVPDAGHYLYIQQPQVCLEEVMKFMGRKE